MAAVRAVADGGHRLLLAQPGPGRERFTEPAVPQRLADLGRELGFSPPEHRPRAEPGAAAQAFGGPGQQRRPFGVVLGERQLGERGQAQGHVAGDAVGQAQFQRLIQQLVGLAGPALHDCQDPSLLLGTGGEPGVAGAISQLTHDPQVLQGRAGTAQGGLRGAGGERGHGCEEGFLLAAELLQAGGHLAEGAREVARDW